MVGSKGGGEEEGSGHIIGIHGMTLKGSGDVFHVESIARVE